MNFKREKKFIFCPFLILLLVLVFLGLSSKAFAQEIFIFRPKPEKNALSQEKKITVHGEFFGHLLSPSTFPSFTDMSGSLDRWNFGFQDIIHFTPSTRFIAQLVTHDDGHQRTKFDWHFSLRQTVFDNLVFIIGHDSNHDSDHESRRDQSRYFLNRNYIGFGIPFETGSFYFEPFTWFFHNSNQRSYLDMSGEKVKQEYGIRLGYWFENGIGIHGQIFTQTDSVLSSGNTYMASVFIRIKILQFLEVSLGSSIWKDIRESPLGNKDKFYKFMWGIALPF
ncbi:MAG: hypothetical protein MUP98_03370 [Candidatus Aminicenantes bacterium]|nr:hypothetical protein [Candidatus Aminicenantes bacterium]